MHPGLETYDILEHICHHLLATSSFSTLAVLARTCTTFTEPALNALWHSIPTLEPLVRCLPEDAWEIRHARYYPILTLTRKTTSADWERCKFYTHRIRQFRYTELDTEALKEPIPTDRTVFMAIKPAPSPTREDSSSSVLTLPKLRSCHLQPHGHAPMPYFASFLAHTLHSLEVTAPAYDPEDILPGILRSVAEASPFLQNLRINGVSVVPPLFTSATAGDPEGAGPWMLTKMLKGLNHLESLICPCIQFPDDAVRYLATGLKIHTLHIKNTAEDILEALTPINEKPWFAHLKRLSVECESDLAECTRLLQYINISEISHLEVGRNSGIPTEYELCTFIHKLSSLSHQTGTTLKTLYIHQNLSTGFVSPAYRPTPASKYTVTLNTLAPLLAFPNLITLKFIFDMGFAFDNNDAECMARAWRNIGELQFGFPGAGWGSGGRVIRAEEASPGTKMMTLNGFDAFARWCPKLKVLGMCVNAGVTSTRRCGGGDNIQCPSLRILEVGDSVYDGTPFIVARHLLSVFPELRGVYGPDVVISPEWQKKWMEVSRIVTTLSSQERTKPCPEYA